MKKSLLLIVTICCCNIYCLSQGNNKNAEWNLGIGFGPTYTSMSIVPNNSTLEFKTKSIQQFQGGLSVRYINEKHVGIIGEINYTQMGWKTKFVEDELAENQHEHTLNYITIPVLTHIFFGDKNRVFINLGPQIGVLFGEKEKSNEAFDKWLTEQKKLEAEGGDNYAPKYSTEIYGMKAQQKIDYGLTAGLGVELRTGIGNFTVEGRYYMGFGDIYKSNKKEPYARSANRAILTKLTYYIKAF